MDDVVVGSRGSQILGSGSGIMAVVLTGAAVFRV
jgi:hypothetical protein